MWKYWIANTNAYFFIERYISVPLSELLPIYYRMHVLAEAGSCAKQLLREIGDWWDIWDGECKKEALNIFMTK